MNFQQEKYLPDAEKRIARLQKIVAGRPIAILAAGPSICELEHRIEELRDADICYFGLNSYTVQETYILQQINKQFSVIMCSSREGVPKTMSDIINFLNRDEDNAFISSFWRDTFQLLLDTGFDIQQFFDDYNKKLVFFNLTFGRTVPTTNDPLHFIVSNSLLVLMQMAIIGKASSIVLFGADGGFKEGAKECYYRQEDLGHRGSIDGKIKVGPVETLAGDTNTYFNPIALIALTNLYSAYGFTPIKILNCSKDSLYTVFPIVSYDTAFEHLLGGV